MEISEQDIIEELNNISVLTNIPLDLESNRIVLNPVGNRKGRVLVLTSKCNKAVLIFRCLVYSCFMANHEKIDLKATVSASLSVLPIFVDFLNSYVFPNKRSTFWLFPIKQLPCFPRAHANCC